MSLKREDIVFVPNRKFTVLKEVREEEGRIEIEGKCGACEEDGILDRSEGYEVGCDEGFVEGL